MSTETRNYNYAVLQTGTLPLTPYGTTDSSVEHRCTSILVWPDGQQARTENTVVTDPCFTEGGFREAASELEGLGLEFHYIGYVFVTHPHLDHALQVPPDVTTPAVREFPPQPEGPFSGIRRVRCPGHMPELGALVFRSPDNASVWIASDAVLNLEWLRAWGYYWPNGYSKSEIVQTWRSVANILSEADVVVPGHGPPISVTASLLAELVAGFPAAEHADACPDVRECLNERVRQLQTGE